jgi:UDP-N-acetylglucosamine diphosphorylase / glucose-1-phosphate thymidylyltransferase / UDP-N-acetylgalactosamine diphosphorylase / glucosamine-1-phosphate N-acetyltransferase / galactosamine-1-phosphate N-acetyltransferase
MSQFYLYDDAVARTFQPFALSRPAGELRAGALLIRERWERALGMSCGGFIGAAHLADFEEFDAPRAVSADALPAGAMLVNARCAPSLDVLGAVDLVETDGRVAAVRLAEGTLPLEDLVTDGWTRTMARGHWLDAPWDLVRHLPAMLLDDLPTLGAALPVMSVPGATILGDHPVWVETGAHVEPWIVFDAQAGPILVAAGASVAAFTRLVGPCYVAPGAQVLGGKVGTSAIGEQCRVHGEVSTAVFIGHANKGHDGFLGHSVLGRWVNLGASTVTSNLKNTYGPVQFWTPHGTQSTGMQFLGTLFGDHAKTAIGTRLTTGCVIGTGANVVGSGLTPKVVSPFLWGEGEGLYDPERFVAVAARMMARRGVTLGERGRRHLARVFAARWEPGD